MIFLKHIFLRLPCAFWRYAGKTAANRFVDFNNRTDFIQKGIAFVLIQNNFYHFIPFAFNFEQRAHIRPLKSGSRFQPSPHLYPDGDCCPWSNFTTTSSSFPDIWQYLMPYWDQGWHLSVPVSGEQDKRQAKACPASYFSFPVSKQCFGKDIGEVIVCELQPPFSG